MPHIVELELSLEGGVVEQGDTGEAHAVSETARADANRLRRADFRIHGGGSRHWLLQHPFGLDLLISKLQKDRPGIVVPRFRKAPELEPLLNSMIDVIGMREWPRPEGARECILAGWFLLKCQICLGLGRSIPDWNYLQRAEGRGG